MSNNTIKASNGAEVYENPMYELLDEYMARKGYNDPVKDITGKQWNAVLMYINKNYFKLHPRILKSKVLKPQSNLLNGAPTNHNAYNYDLLTRVCDDYIFFCADCDKIPELIGFSALTGINVQVVSSWQHEDSINPRYLIYKKIMSSQESALGTESNIIAMARLNKYHGYNGSGTQTKTVEHVPALEDIQNKYKSLPVTGDSEPIDIE